MALNNTRTPTFYIIRQLLIKVTKGTRAIIYYFSSVYVYSIKGSVACIFCRVQGLGCVCLLSGQLTVVGTVKFNNCLLH